ncbi:response regulator [Rosettibacter firmus]|uniref:response regulator n=1 Tax=Rosettibacter firmus TaxID=3111522 RepID=UPI00336BB0CE
MKFKLLFVDKLNNEQNRYQSLSDILGEQYEIYFASDSQEALNTLKNNDIDVCLIQFDSTSFNSLDLLTKIKRSFPKTIRILLSEDFSEKLSIRTFNLLHQVIKCPIEDKLLKEKLEPLLILKNLIKNDKLISKLNSEDGIPTLPEIYFKLEKELFSPEVSIHKVVNLISKDISLTTKIFQLVNSAYYGIPAKITDFYQAVNILGLNVIKSIVIYTKVFAHLEKKGELKEIIEAIWNHSILVSSISQKIIFYFTGNRDLAEQAYIAGILHDIGKIILINIEPNYIKELKISRNNAFSDDDLEKSFYGVSHTEIGAYALALWGFPRSIVDAALLHHSSTIVNDFSVSNIIQISHKLANIEGIDSVLYDTFISKEALIEYLSLTKTLESLQ